MLRAGHTWNRPDRFRLETERPVRRTVGGSAIGTADGRQNTTAHADERADRCRHEAAHTGRDTLPHDRSEAGTYGVAHGSEPASGCADRVAGGLRINGG